MIGHKDQNLIFIDFLSKNKISFNKSEYLTYLKVVI